ERNTQPDDAAPKNCSDPLRDFDSGRYIVFNPYAAHIGIALRRRPAERRSDGASDSGGASAWRNGRHHRVTGFTEWELDNGGERSGRQSTARCRDQEL